MHHRIRFNVLTFLTLLTIRSTAAPLPDNYKLVYEQNFTAPNAIDQFVMSDPGAWRQFKTNDNGALELVRQSQYKPAVRSPVNIALIRDKAFGDFVLEADLIQTGREYGHRDMCVYLGFQNPTNFYYVHVATKADPHAHNIFVVTNAPRIAIAKETTKGVDWGLGVWHKLRVERDTAKGTIKVFFDDLSKPIMVAEDKTFASGHIGFGSFDDTGMIDNIKVWAPTAQQRSAEFFQPAK
jgi:hypothetical protein